jgi:hypothetical protein
MRRDRCFEGARRWCVVALLALLTAPACRCSQPDASEAMPSASAPKASLGSAHSTAPSANAAKPPLKAPCRVTTGTGTLEGPNEAVGPRTGLDGTRFVVLAAGERISLRHERTERELALLGPGRFLPCHGGDEQVLVVSGGVKSNAGVGVHAGGEVVIATPFGVVRYVDAAVDMTVEASQLSVHVLAGEVSFDDPPDKAGERRSTSVLGAARGTRPTKLDLPPPDTLVSPKAADPKMAVEHCRSTRASSRAFEKPPRPAGSARAALGTWAVASFEARRAARLACALARVVIESRPEPERRRLEDLLESRESRPKAAASPPPAEKK